jgi:hypothetical protein
MIAAGNKKARLQGGPDAGVKSLSNCIVSNKQIAVKAKIIHLQQAWNLEIAEFQRFAIFVSRLYLEYAPPEIRGRFMGPPSETPHETIELAEIFLLLYGTAEDKAKASDAAYSLCDLWQAAVQLAGGA